MTCSRGTAGSRPKALTNCNKGDGLDTFLKVQRSKARIFRRYTRA